MNAEHYPDTTVDTAIRNEMPKQGEIWTDDKGWLYIILKNQGSFCNVITMIETDKPVYKVGEYGIDPARVSYLRESKYGKYVRTLSQFEFDMILSEVSSKFCVNILVNKTEETIENAVLMNRIKELEDELKEQKKSTVGDQKYWKKVALSIIATHEDLLNRLGKDV